MMQKDFYASGFLFHSGTQQILLQQPTPQQNVASTWTLLGEPYTGEEKKPEVIFQNLVNKLFDIKVEKVHSIYSYLNEETNRTHFLLYAHVAEQAEFPEKNGMTYSWFSFKEVLKLKADKQTKHDIVVGKRVIEAAERFRLGEHTFQ